MTREQFLPPQRPEAAGQLVNDLPAGHGGAERVQIGDVAEEHAGPQGLQRPDGRGFPHEAGDVVAVGRQSPDEVQADEAAAAGDEDFGHGSSLPGAGGGR